MWLVTEWAGKIHRTKVSTCENETGILRMKWQWKADNRVGIYQIVYVEHLHVETQTNFFFSCCRGGTHSWLCVLSVIGLIWRPPDDKNGMNLGCQHSRGLAVKHVVATYDANNGCDEGRYQPCCPGAAGKTTCNTAWVTTIHTEQKGFVINVIRACIIQSRNNSDQNCDN